MFRPAAPACHPPRTPRRHLAPATRAGAIVAAAGAVALGGCHDVTVQDQNPTTVAFAPGLGIRLSDYTHDTSGVYYLDVAVGSGTKAVTGSTLSYYYTGYLADGRTFSTNTNLTSPSTFVLGAGQVVRGFDRGLLGINGGGRRRLIIPPALGYGDKTTGTSIPAGSILIFEIDVPVVTPPTVTKTTSTLK